MPSYPRGKPASPTPSYDMKKGQVSQYTDLIYDNAAWRLRSNDKRTVAAAALLHNTLNSSETSIIIIKSGYDILSFATYRIENKKLIVERIGSFNNDAFRVLISEIRETARANGVLHIFGMRTYGDVMVPKRHQL